MQKLYPLHAPLRIGAGRLEASNRLYTKHSVSDYTPPAGDARTTPLEVSVFSADGILVRSFAAVGKASVELSDGELLIVAIKEKPTAPSLKSDDAQSAIAPHLTMMTYFTHAKAPELAIMHDWITTVSQQNTVAGAVDCWSNFSLPSLFGELPWNPPVRGELASADALLMYGNVRNRSVNEFGWLQPQWKAALTRWVAARRPFFDNGTAVGIFTGDEMGCGTTKVSPSNYSAILKELRALVGSKVIIYANDCIRDLGSSLHPKGVSTAGCCKWGGLKIKGKCSCDRVDFSKMPAELDLISMDCCEFRRSSHAVQLLLL